MVSVMFCGGRMTQVCFHYLRLNVCIHFSDSYSPYGNNPCLMRFTPNLIIYIFF